MSASERALLICLCFVTGVAPARAETVQGIRAATSTPLAPRGGVMQIPLTAAQPGTGWPATLPLELADGVRLQGTVAWLHRTRLESAAARRWTADASGLGVRTIAPTDDTSRVDLGSPLLLVRLPPDGGGSVVFMGEPLSPRWFDPPPPATGPALKLESRPDRPDPASPLEYWRWTLLADQLGQSPPEIAFSDPAAAFLAEHYATIWRSALARLAAASPGVAAACRDQLTRIAMDGEQPFAAWVAQPAVVNDLLERCLDPDRDGDRLARAALAWSDAQSPLIAWPELVAAQEVRVAMVNQGLRPLVVRGRWTHVEEDVPIAVEIPAGQLTIVRLDRPPPPTPGLLGEVPEEPPAVLTLTASGVPPIRLAVGPRHLEARPPGVFLTPFRAPLTLAELQAGRQRAVAANRGTIAHVRRRAGRWEIFVDCRRPTPTTLGPQAEAVTLRLGPPQTPFATLLVPESGVVRRLDGDETLPNSLLVERRSYTDRWYMRMVVPDPWGGDPGPIGLFRLGCRRQHGDGEATETAPLTGPPWRRVTGAAEIDLNRWDD
ncbi:MAG: hypothetical protein HKN62_06415 [Phycisphaerales bacterium]|nr:hypothetical protein [Phycisphaerales bacterium]